MLSEYRFDSESLADVKYSSYSVLRSGLSIIEVRGGVRKAACYAPVCVVLDSSGVSYS